MTWLEECKAVPLGAVLAAFGDMKITRSMFGPCPACNETNRDGQRPACGTRDDGWRCWRCGVSGNNIQLVFWRLAGKAPVPGVPEWSHVRAWYANQGWCEPTAGERRVAPKPKVTARDWVAASIERPPPAEVRALLMSSHRPDQAEPTIQAWIRSRGLDPATIPCGILPAEHWWPSWWPWERTPRGEQRDTRGVYRLAVPAYNERGEVVSLHARAVLPTTAMVERGLFRTKKDGTPEVEKTRWPARFASVGLIFADPWRGKHLLRGSTQGAPVRRIVVVEGLTDFAAAGSAFHGTPDVAVYGGTEGSWETFGRVAWPATAEFYLATDPDKTGDRFARVLCEQLSRWRCYRVPLATLGVAA